MLLVVALPFLLYITFDIFTISIVIKVNKSVSLLLLETNKEDFQRHIYSECLSRESTCRLYFAGVSLSSLDI